jgi:hypothetical protein
MNGILLKMENIEQGAEMKFGKLLTVGENLVDQ